MKIPISVPFPDRLRQSFGVSTANALLGKAFREFADFNSSESIQRSGDHAFNLCVSIWHLHDWVFADMSPEERRAASSFLDFQINKKIDFAVAVQRRCKEVRICRVMATAGKHVEVDTYPDPSIETAFDFYAHANDDSKPFLIRWSISYQGIHIDAADMFSAALKFWRELFEHLGWVEPRLVTGDEPE